MTDHRVGRTCVAALGALWWLTSQSACTGILGAPVDTSPTRMMAQASNMAARGDTIGAEHMHHRVQVAAPGTLTGVLATLERHAVGDLPEARAIRMFGGPTDDPWDASGDGRFAGGGLGPGEAPPTEQPWRDGDTPSPGLERCR